MFGQPKIYTVHLNPDQPRAQEQAVFVREGFSASAFAFTFFWALYHRMWRYAVYIFMAQFVISAAYEAGSLTLASAAVAQAALQLWLGFNGRDMQRASLAQRGFITADIIAEENLTRAERRFFERYA